MIVIEVDEGYDEPAVYTGIALSIKDGLTEPKVRLDKEGDGNFTVHRASRVRDISLE